MRRFYINKKVYLLFLCIVITGSFCACSRGSTAMPTGSVRLADSNGIFITNDQCSIDVTAPPSPKAALAMNADGMDMMHDIHTSDGQKIDQNYKYIVPKIYKGIEISNDLELIKVFQSNYYMGCEKWDEGYLLYDFYGNIVVNYGVYDDISFMANGAYVTAQIGDKIIYLDKTGKKADLPDNAKIYDVLVINSDTDYDRKYAIESKDYIEIVDAKTNSKLEISKNGVLISDDDEIHEIVEMYGIIEVCTRYNHLFYSENGELLNRMDKWEYGQPFDSQAPLDFRNPKGYAGFRFENQLCGVIDVYGNIIIKPEYQAIELAGDYAEVRKNDKWGLIDLNNNILFDFTYDDIPAYIGNNNFIFFDDEKSYIINPKDPDRYKDVVFKSYSWTSDSSSGIVGENLDGKWGALSSTGETIIPFVYDYIFPYIDTSENMIRVGLLTENNIMKYGFVDMKGNVKIPIVYDDTLEKFSEGLCAACYARYDVNGNVIGKDWFFINKGNETVLRFDDDVYIDQGFSEGLAVITRGTDNYGYGCEYIDKKGNTIIANNDWTYVGSFKNGLAIVNDSISGGSPSSNDVTTYGVIKYTGDTLPK